MCFLVGFAISVWAQDRMVTGKVTSADDGLALPGVNVVVKGSTNGTVTDATGEFKIGVPATGGVLVFSFIGMATQEVEIGARSVVDLQMKTDVKQLQEVVVNALGENVEKDKLGIAQTTVAGNAVVQSGETGLINGMAGKAAGVLITRNGGDPGAGSYIQLRGQSTITGDLQPLIVIDGMPMFNSTLGANTVATMGSNAANMVGGTQQQSRLNDLNPADIASMEVIKSAAGAALWGSRAANGVIVITTKKGKNSKGKVNVSYTGTVSIDQVNKMPELQTTFGQGSQGGFVYGTSTSYGDLISNRSGGADTFITGTGQFFDPSSGNDRYAGTSYGYAVLPDGTKRYAIPSAGDLDSNGNPLGLNGGKNSKNTYDHTKDIFQTGHYVDHNIVLNSGNEKTQFYVSYENLAQQGIIKMNSDYNKNSGRVNITTEITKKLHATVMANYTNTRSNRIQQGSNTSGILLGMLRTPPDFDNSIFQGTFYPANGSPASFDRQLTFRSPLGKGAFGTPGSPGYDNPVWTINKNHSFSVVNRFLGNFELTYDANDWLTLRGNAGLDSYTDRRTDYIHFGSASALTGQYGEQYVQESQFNVNLYATARKTFSESFAGNLLLGFNYNNRQFNNVGGSGTNFIAPEAPPNLANIPPANRVAFNSAITQRTTAGFLQANMDIINQISISLTGRAESASTFGPQASSVFFYPSATASWQFSKMIGTNNFLSFGKLRASAGVVGKQPDPYQNLTQYGSQTYVDAFGGTLEGSNYGLGGYAISAIAGNPKIRPEKKHELEVGTDLRFFNDRVNFSATAYYNQTTDAILQSQLPPSSGFSNYISNAGSIENKGLELTLGATLLKMPNGFTWNANVIWFAYRNLVTNLAGAQYVFLAGFTDGASVATKGKPLGELWGTFYQRNSDGSMYTDANGFAYVNSNTGPIGNPNPDYRVSFGNTFSYRNLSLYFLLDASVGGKMWNGTQGALYNFGTNKGSATTTTVSAADAAALNTYDGNTVATSGRATQNSDGTYTFRGTVHNFGAGNVALDQAWYQGAGSGFNVNEPFVQNATWTRLREVTLAYTLNSQGFKTATKLSSLSFSLTGRNLLLWTPYQGIDPDTNLTGTTNGRGLDYFQNPNTKSIIFKLTLAF